MPKVITSPHDLALDELCRELAARAEQLDASGHWPADQLRLCGEYGVYQWFIDSQWGGQAWGQENIVRGYLKLSAACLTTTFVLTQRDGACRRTQSADNQSLKDLLLPPLARGDYFATVGISHLTTSRRHETIPVLRARRVSGGFELDGFSPWVTGADNAKYIVIGATLMDGDQPTTEQLLAVVPTDIRGATASPTASLVGLSASHTGRFELNQVFVEQKWLLAGPMENVMSHGAGAGTGGLGTSTLAIGLTSAALKYLADEANRRPDLETPLDALRTEHTEIESDLLAAVRGQPACSNDELRQRANSLVLRSTQAALAAAKGSGYVVGHPAGRWCREALFFLVWSCPQPVLSANLCELAGILD
jgi:alkylation response protein AidB-like acyl-CoA dehydrogenase